MSDDLLKRLRDRDHVGTPTEERNLVTSAADRIEELEERLNAATEDAKEAEAYAAEMQERLDNLIAGAETVLEEWDRGDERAFLEAFEEMRADVAAAKREK